MSYDTLVNLKKGLDIHQQADFTRDPMAPIKQNGDKPNEKAKKDNRRPKHTKPALVKAGSAVLPKLG